MTTGLASVFGALARDVLGGADRVHDLRTYAQDANPRYRWYRHCAVLADVLERVAQGQQQRVMVFMPPRHGKSELVSRIFPAYYLAKHPEAWVGLTSYAADLAYTFSRLARQHFKDAGGALSPDAQGVQHWETAAGGGLWAAGVGGPITGKGGDLLIIDDPIKNAEEALSETVRKAHKEWYESTLYTRAEPGCSIVIVQTRWHEDDLSGYLLSKEQGEEPEGWHVVNFEALRGRDEPDLPDTCTVEPDWREIGEALCPERYNVQALEKIKARIGGVFWSALYAQRPTSLEGEIFKRSWWQFYTRPDHPIPGVPPLPEKFERMIQSWDMAFKDEDKNDYVAGGVWGRVGARFYLLDRVNEHLSFTATCDAVRQMTAKWPRATAKYIEDKANGPAVVNALFQQVSGVIPVKPDGGKVARAYAVQPLAEAKQVYLPHPEIAPWVEDFINQLAQFPRGAHDDDVDMTTQALNRLSWGAHEDPPAEAEWKAFSPEALKADVERLYRNGARKALKQKLTKYGKGNLDPFVG